MADLSKYDDTVWDRYFSFVSSDEDAMAPSDVKAILQSLGIDVRPSISQITQAIQAQIQRTQLERAKRIRPSLTRDILSISASLRDTAMKDLKELISSIASVSQQAILFRSLEDAHNEEDIRSLLDDIERLNSLPDRMENPDLEGK